MRTPPRNNNNSQASGGGGIMMRDDYVPNPRVTSGPVKRSPPRADDKTPEDYHEEDAKVGIVPQPSNENSNFEAQSPPPKVLPERQMSTPSSANPISNLVDSRQSPDYVESRLYEDFMPKKNYPSSPKSQMNSYDPSKITTFGSRIDELLAETKNKIDEITPKSEYIGPHGENDFSKGYNYMMPAQMNSYPHSENMNESINTAGMMPGMTMMPTYVYNQGPYIMAYYPSQGMLPAQMIPTQGMMPQGMMPQGIMPQSMMPQAMMQPGMYQMSGYSGQMMSDGGMGQPMYQVYYQQPNQSNTGGYNNHY